jgi:hypothetical protein
VAIASQLYLPSVFYGLAAAIAPNQHGCFTTPVTNGFYFAEVVRL